MAAPRKGRSKASAAQRSRFSERTCQFEGCGQPVGRSAAGGRPRKWCPIHAPPQNRKRDADRAKANGDDETAAALLAAGGGQHELDPMRLPEEMQAALLRAGMKLHPEPGVAASAVGLGALGKRELKRLVKRSLELFPHGITIAKWLEANLMITAIHSLVEAGKVPPAQRAQASQRVAQTIQVLHAANATTFAGPVRVEWVEADE